jgi:outer membrane protein TolC
MKAFLFIFLFLICVAERCAAQWADSLLLQIERNNTLLPALKQQTAADRIANRTGLLPSNPEVEFHYLWGNEAAPGNRKDFSVTQNFDFPATYYYRRKLAGVQDQQVDLNYLAARNDLLLEAKQQAVWWVYHSNRLRESNLRLAHAQEIEKACRAKYEAGEMDLPEYNRARINLLNRQKDVNVLETAQEQSRMELLRMNGGKDLMLPSDYLPVQLPSDFEQWLAGAEAKNASLLRLRQATAANRVQMKLQRSLNLPKISLGYMSERVLTEQFRGITAGISIPLWENKNTVRKLRSQAAASQAMEHDAQIRFRNEAQMLYKKAARLLQTATEYRQLLRSSDNTALLTKAFTSGERSLIEYITELGIYYETVDYLLETEKDFQLTVAELYRWEL